MRRGLNSQAYTIVEVIIVLAVSSALLVSALLFVGGQQRKTEFYQSIHDIEQQIQQVMNDVSTGYYAKTTDFTCTGSGGSLSFTSSATTQGTNTGCVFLGRAIQFGVSGSDGKNFNIYNIVGLRQTSSGMDVTKLSDASPTVLPDNIESRNLKNGLKVTYVNTDPQYPTSILAFVSSWSHDESANKLISGSMTANLYIINNAGPGLSSAEAIIAINTASSFLPVSGVTLCFASGGTDQYGVITIGGDNRQLSTKLDILSTFDATKAGGPCV